MQLKIGKLLFVSLLFLFSLKINAQDSLQVAKEGQKTIKKDSIVSHWDKVNKASLDISEVAFVNWNAGGSNSVSGLLGLELQRNYHKDLLIWENKALFKYGVNKQQEQDLRKTEDLLELDSRFGFRKDTISNWYYSANFSFKTQFTNGYNYSKSDTEPISRFMAPAYLFLGVGAVYGEHIKEFSAYLSPLTLKSTFVLDQDLADSGAFGVDEAVYDEEGNRLEKGKNTRNEVGILITSSYNKEVLKNILMKTSVNLYTDYLNDFGNVDVDWRLDFDFTVNEFVRATLGSHLKYDNDVKSATDENEEMVVSGAKVQWKQLLGIGVLVDF